MKPTCLRFLYLLFACFCLAAIPARAQYCEWLNGEGSIMPESPMSIATDNSNNAIVCGYYRDSFSVNGIPLPLPLAGNSHGLLIKYNKNGVALWVAYVAPVTPTTNFSFTFTDLATDANGNIYASGTLMGNANMGNGVTVSGASIAVLVKYDSNGVALWAKGASKNPAGLKAPVAVDADGNVVWSMAYTVSIGFTGFNQTLFSNGGMDAALVKYTPAGQFISAASFGGIGTETVKDLATDGNSNIYLLGYSDTTLVFGAQTLNRGGEILLKTDSAFHPIRGKKTYLNDPHFVNNYITAMDVQPNGKFAVTSTFNDTVDFGGVVLGAPSTLISKTSRIVYYDTNFTALWGHKTDIVTNGPVFPYIYTISIKNGGVYFAGHFSRNSIRFDSLVLKYIGIKNSWQIYAIKTDTLGNFLWGFTNNDSIGNNSIVAAVANNEGDLYLTGNYYRSMGMFNRSIQPKYPGNNDDIFVAKISDYGIYRGNISHGPHCAGDSIKIPYSKKGFYNPGNQFIAELSDSAGNFTGGQRELGRLQDTASGVINGILPAINVPTNNKYRIRITSTSPVVRSYYVADTLQLLIFSKDTANAGPDTLLCYHKPIRLATSGGTRWHWSPATCMAHPADTAARNPLVYADTTVHYRVIISDSMGCGVTDTDYVTTYARPPLKTHIKGDSVICRGYGQTLEAVVTGGDSTKYWYAWKTVGFSIIQSKTPKLAVRPASTTQYMLVVGDSCGDKIDTVYFTVRVENSMVVLPSPDTLVCKGKTATLRAAGIGCNPAYYRYEWYEKDKPALLGVSATLNVSPSTTTHYLVMVTDSTTLVWDTAIVKVTVDSIFSISTLPDTTICTGQSIDLKARVFSCDTSAMVYTWDNGLGTGDTKTVSPVAATTYRVIGENTFNGLRDTAFVKVTVRPPLGISINTDTTICLGETAELRAIAGGGSMATHKILWTADSGPWTNNNATVVISPSITTTYKALLSDNCSMPNDSAFITVTVRPPLKVTVNTDTTICIGETAELRATASGGYAPRYNVVWSEVGGQSIVNSPQTTVSPITSTIYKALLTDNCSTPGGSATITVTVRGPLKITLNPDTTICIGQRASLRAVTTGGYAPQHKILWAEIGSQWVDTNKSVLVSPTATSAYKAVLTDNCSMQNDSAAITVTVRPPLLVSAVAKDSICSNQVLLLTAAPSGGYAPQRQIQWTVDGGPWTSFQNPATDTPKVNSTYVVQLSDNCSPNVVDTLTVAVLPTPKAGFTITPAQGCPPLPVSFKDASTGNDSAKNNWTFGPAEYRGVGSGAHEFTKTGSYTIALRVSNALGCTDQKIQHGAVTVFEKPAASFVVKPEIKEIETPILLFNTSQKASLYMWDLGNGNLLYQNNRNDTFFIYRDTGLHTLLLVAQNNRGCKDTARLQVHIFDKINCAIPSAFTPGNTDNLNPVFAPVCVGVANYTLTIYNRWGQVIRQCENCVWDGTYDGQTVPQGVYMYKLQLLGDSKLKSLIYGTVNVIR